MGKKHTLSEAMIALQQVSYGAEVLESIDKNTLYKVKLKNVVIGREECAAEIIERIAKWLNKLAFDVKLHERAMKTKD